MLDGFFQFISAIGVSDKVLQWDIPLAESDKQWANTLTSDQSVLVINPSSSQRLNNWRNWRAANYAKLIKYAIHVTKWFEKNLFVSIIHL